MGLGFAIIWILLFLWRKDTKKEILFFSIISGFAGLLADIIYTIDWWHPVTLTGTRVGPEAFLAGFMIGGIAAVIYEDVFKKKVRIRKEPKSNLKIIYMIGLALILFFGSFFLLKTNSLISTILAFTIPTIIMWIKRKDLILDSLASGVLMLITASIVYTFLNIVTPGWIQAFWVFENTPNIIFLNLPLDDIYCYFLIGAYIGPLYEYWKEGKLIQK